MINSNSGRVGVVGALILCGALAGCGDNGNEVGWEEMPDGAAYGNVATTASGGSGVGGSGPDVSDAAVVNTASGGSGVGGSGPDVSDAAAVTTASGGSGTGGGGADVSNVATTASGGSGVGGQADVSNVATTASGGTGAGGGPAETSGSGGTGAGGGPAETTPCGPEELELNCESDEICRGVQTFGPAEYSCHPNPCFEHDQANSCECAASLCGSEAPNCVMLEEDTVVACVCVFC